MKLLHFENYKNFVQAISDTFDSLNYGYDDISIIAKYSESKKNTKRIIMYGV